MKPHEIKKPSGWTPKQIKDSLEDVGLNQAAVARACEVTPTTVNDVIHGLTCSQKIHKFIGKVINEDPKVIWPQYYKHGTPKRGRRMIIWVPKAA